MIAALLLVAAAAGGAPEPSYVVERVVRVGDDMRRTSVFRNGVAVAVREKGGKRVHFARETLDDVELKVIVQVTEEAYPELRRFAGPVDGPGFGTVEFRLAPPGMEPLTVRFPAGSVESLAAARIGQALDGLDAEMARFRGEREDLRNWEPRVGESVQLEDGRTVEVRDVLYSQTGVVLRLQIGDGPASIYLSEDELRRLAVRRVKR